MLEYSKCRLPLLMLAISQLLQIGGASTWIRYRAKHLLEKMTNMTDLHLFRVRRPSFLLSADVAAEVSRVLHVEE